MLVDVDGNSLIDFGSGIAVTSVGNSAPRVAERVREQVGQVHPHLLHGHARTRGTSRCARNWPGAPRATTRSGRRCSTPAPRRWRTRSRSPGTYTGRQAVVAFDHAYHGRTNLTMALTAKNMPYKDKFGPFAGRDLPDADGLPAALARRPGASAPRRPSTWSPALIHTQVGEDNVAAVIIEPIQGEGGFIVPPDGFLPGLAEFCRRARHRVHRRRDPDRLLPDRRLVRLRPRGRRARPGHHGQGHRRRAAAGRGHRAGRDHGLGARRRPRRHLRRQPGRLRRRARRDRDDGGRGPGRAGPPDRRDHAAPAAQAGRHLPGHRATSAAAAR